MYVCVCTYIHIYIYIYIYIEPSARHDGGVEGDHVRPQLSVGRARPRQQRARVCMYIYIYIYICIHIYIYIYIYIEREREREREVEIMYYARSHFAAPAQELTAALRHTLINEIGTPDPDNQFRNKQY